MIGQAIQMVKAVHYGSASKALQNPKRNDWEPEYGGPVDLEKLTKACTKWFGEIFNSFGGVEVLSDQSKVIRSIPVRLALSAMGHARYTNKLDAIPHGTDALNQVNWNVREAWNGIAGKVTKKTDAAGNEYLSMSAASGKETITRAVSAITNPKAPGKPGGPAWVTWYEIRGLKPPALESLPSGDEFEEAGAA